MTREHHVSAMETVTEKCHVCDHDFRDTDEIVTHIGHTGAWVDTPGEARKKGRAPHFHENRGAITMHPECATILAMRLIHDVMGNVPLRAATDRVRVTTALQRLNDAYLMKD
jgi:hypothetical protein